MAYSRSSKAGSSPLRSSSSSSSRVWEELRKEARKLEGEIDVKLAAFGKLCSGFDSYSLKHDAAASNDRLAGTKRAELEGLLKKLSDVNEAMSSSVAGGDPRSHTLARHRDIHHDYVQEFERLSATMTAANRDRLELLGGDAESAPLMGMQGGDTHGALMRERNTIGTAGSTLEDVLGTAQAVAANLGEQRRIFDGVGNKLMTIGAKFPVVNGLLNAIRRKKSKDTIILAAVIAGCTVFTIIYWLNK